MSVSDNLKTIQRVQAEADDTRCLLVDLLDKGGHTPVDKSRLIQARQYFDNAIAVLDWFTRQYPDNRPISK